MKRHNGFTMTELLVVVAVIALLASLLIPTLSHSLNTAYRVFCLNNLHHIQLASSMYSLDNSGFLPPHDPRSKWPSQLQSILKDPRGLFCPVDLLDLNSSPTNFTAPFDSLPRSYIMNGFYDFFKTNMASSEFTQLFTKGLSFGQINESEIADPANTLVFGEKTDTNVFYLNVTVPFMGFLAVLDESRHGFKNGTVVATGANYSMADGSVTFLKFATDTSPLNMWGVTEASRTDAVICRPR